MKPSTPIRVVTSEQMRELDRVTSQDFSVPTAVLMENAGRAVARQARRLIRSDQRASVVCGPGNNGGDGLVAARHLANSGIGVEVLLLSESLKGDAGVNLAAFRKLGGVVRHFAPERALAFERADLIIDAIFGIGLTRPIEGKLAEVVAHINAQTCPVLAIDIPSGLCADTGRVLGIAVRATLTLGFIAGKPGLHTLDGPDHCGEIVVDSLGVDVGKAEGLLILPELFRACLKPRLRNTHKGDFGSVGIIGGAPGMAGAALLAGRAALRLGAGRVYVGMLERLPIDIRQPELMLRRADEVFGPATVLAIGPGLGQSTEAHDLLLRALDTPLPLAIDADALNLLAAHPVLLAKVSRGGTARVLTPHPAEAARLLGTTTEAIQADRIAAALELARRCKAHVVLKGCGSIVASPVGGWYINTTGNAGLASAGSGDVLTGMIAALLAQHWPPREAVLAATYLHGAAADALVAAASGPVGLAAGELIDVARTLLNRWIADA